MKRQARYRRAQLEAGKCATGCGTPRWGHRTTCRTCTMRRAQWRRDYYRTARV